MLPCFVEGRGYGATPQLSRGRKTGTEKRKGTEAKASVPSVLLRVLGESYSTSVMPRASASSGSTRYSISRSSSMSSSLGCCTGGGGGGSSAGICTWRYHQKPVPAGIRRPIVTFSFRPRKQSILPEIAASVSTRVGSWNDAALMNDSVDCDALAIPS